MQEKVQKQTTAWPKNSSTQLTSMLDAFLSAPIFMPHSYLFLGSSRDESDALQLAKTFAEKITENKFPNVDTITFDASQGEGVEGIREVLSLAALMPVSSERKVVLMLHMDKASPQMLNALLKTLEEPPAHAIFMLLSDRPLLPTVMSRCQVFSLQEASAVTHSAELAEALDLLQTNRTAGQAERMVLVIELANLEDELLPQVLEQWLTLQVAELKTTPQKYPAVRATTEALLSLRGNFNKKMVLQQFVTTGLL